MMDYPGTSDVRDLPASPYSLHIPYQASVLRASTVAVDDASAPWKACGEEDHGPPSDMGAWAWESASTYRLARSPDELSAMTASRAGSGKARDFCEIPQTFAAAAAVASTILGAA
jgi:hypothetical protein